jgi:hypothetical protein
MSIVERGTPVRTVAGLEFFSDPWPNLHHVLYAAAWQRRREAAAESPAESGGPRSPMAWMPAPLAELPDSDAAIWADAVGQYDAEVASKDLLFSPEMMRQNQALADGVMDSCGADAAVRRRSPRYCARLSRCIDGGCGPSTTRSTGGGSRSRPRGWPS